MQMQLQNATGSPKRGATPLFFIFMLSFGSEKWLNPEHESDRCEALENSSRFTDAELEDLGVDRIRGDGVNDPDTYLIDSSPVDPEGDPKGDAIDVRTIPGHD